MDCRDETVESSLDHDDLEGDESMRATCCLRAHKALFPSPSPFLKLTHIVFEPTGGVFEPTGVLFEPTCFRAHRGCYRATFRDFCLNAIKESNIINGLVVSIR